MAAKKNTVLDVGIHITAYDVQELYNVVTKWLQAHKNKKELIVVLGRSALSENPTTPPSSLSSKKCVALCACICAPLMPVRPTVPSLNPGPGINPSPPKPTGSHQTEPPWISHVGRPGITRGRPTQEW